MKNVLASSLRLAAFASTLFALTLSTRASDYAAETLASAGSVRIEAAGPYVTAGTCQIQVSAKLGRPSARLADDTWLYHHFHARNSAGSGTLVVRFNAGRVSSLALVSPAVITTLRATPASRNMARFVATRAAR